MPKPEKELRNREIVAKRWEDPKKWSFQALGVHFNLNKKTAYDVWRRYKDLYKPKD